MAFNDDEVEPRLAARAGRRAGASWSTIAERIGDMVHRIDCDLHGAAELSSRTQFGAEDGLLDSLWPSWAKSLSEVHWTPVRVAIQAVQLLRPDAAERVLDMGSGIGKFCTIGGMLHRSATFYGVEQRMRLIRVAQKIARQLSLDNIHYLHGAIHSIDLDEFDAAYMFNPFGEHLFEHEPQIDAFHKPTFDRYLELVTLSEQHLETARVGFRVVTYHGFGGVMPRSYERLASQPSGTDFLELWMKRK